MSQYTDIHTCPHKSNDTFNLHRNYLPAALENTHKQRYSISSNGKCITIWTNEKHSTRLSNSCWSCKTFMRAGINWLRLPIAWALRAETSSAMHNTADARRFFWTASDWISPVTRTRIFSEKKKDECTCGFTEPCSFKRKELSSSFSLSSNVNLLAEGKIH